MCAPHIHIRRREPGYDDDNAGDDQKYYHMLFVLVCVCVCIIL